MPVLIVGGGRWGRVWASVIVSARGDARDIVMAARTDPVAARQWAGSDSAYSGIEVCEGIAQAMSRNPELKAAIVCSRPRDHLADVLEALRFGLHVLVEKPIAIDAQSARQMQAAAEQAQRKLSVGTEFAHLPALHQCAAERAWGGSGMLEVDVDWRDVRQEARYGAIKARHTEVGAMGDLLPHAFSIFQVLAPERSLQLTEVHHHTAQAGGMVFRDGRRGTYTLRFDLCGAERIRRIRVRTERDYTEIDFSGTLSRISIDARVQPLDPRLVSLTSTLRLEFGAFAMSLADADVRTMVDPSVGRLIELQQQLEALTRGTHV